MKCVGAVVGMAILCLDPEDEVPVQRDSREGERNVSTEVPSTHTSTNELRGVEIHTIQDSLDVYSQINTYIDSYDLKLTH